MIATDMDSNRIIELWEDELRRPKTEDLIVYNSLAEKDNAFGSNVEFESTSKFLGFIKYTLPKIMSDKKVIYRGVSQAKYRLFNTAQRAFMQSKGHTGKDEKLYHQSIQSMIENARNVSNGALANFLKSTGLNDSDVSILAFLQHYGAPTPLMDWTTDIYVSLYFAVRDLTDDEIKWYFENQNGSNIDDYFSIYILIEDHILGKISEFTQLSLTTKTTAQYNTLRKKPFQYINERFKSGKPVFSLFNNLRITNQKGQFIYNNSSFLPLEEVFCKKWLMFWLVNNAKGLTTARSPIMCLNVHKSIAHAVKHELLTENGYTDARMFPTPEKIVEQAVPDIFKLVK